MRARRWAGIGAALVALVTTGLPLAPAGGETTGPITEACPAAEIADEGFADVPAGGPHADAVACLRWWEVVRGRTDESYGPADHLARDAMASFLARLLRAAGGDLPSSPDNAFADDDASVHHYAINRLADVGILSGLGDGSYGPALDVTRGQIATLIVNAYEQFTGSPLPDGDDAFTDDDGSVHEDAIDRAAAAGLARGVAPGQFAPDQPASREQVASFLARALQRLVDAGMVESSPATRRADTKLITEDCDALLGFLKEQSLPYVTPWGMDVVGAPVVSRDGDDSGGEDGEDSGGEDPAAGPEAPPAAPEADGPDPVDHSDTNNQEEGVDEADSVKTDGTRLFSAVGGVVRALDLTGPAPVVVGTLDLPASYDRELVLEGDRLLVVSTDFGYIEGPVPVADEGFAPPSSGPVTRIDLVDVSDLANMQIVSTLTIDGSAVATRTVDGVARLVLEAAPAHLSLGVPESSEDEAQAAQENREAVETSDADDWLPHYEHTTAGGTVSDSGPLLDCADVAMPPEFSGVGILSVLSLDLDGDLTPGAVTGVLGSWGTVYASLENLYVATTAWSGWSPTEAEVADTTTAIHRFSITDPTVATYETSGKVDGWALNQFSLSEHAGHLRIATTSDPPWTPEGPVGEGQSRVVVLDGALLPVGMVEGLGLGERIYAVRFIGDRGYVVTFRQVDPLYVLDLSDPTAPTVTGELKITGFSAYLHPVGDGLLLGVGRDADEEGQVQGLQLSLFDVSDPANPTRLHQATLADAYSAAEYDHHAFLYWPATGLTVLPVDVWPPEGEPFTGAVGFDVDVAAGIGEVGRVSHPAHTEEEYGYSWTPPIERSVVVGDSLLTISLDGVLASGLDDLQDRAWVPFS